MKTQVYHQIELTGASVASIDVASIEEAIERANADAHKPEQYMGSIQEKDTSGRTDKGKVTEWQLRIKVGVGADK